MHPLAQFSAGFHAFYGGRINKIGFGTGLLPPKKPKWGHNQSAKTQSLGTSARVRSQLICMQVNSREKIIDTLKIERFQHDVDWAIPNKLQQKQRTPSKTKSKKQV